jgi:DNA-directed RNA polymerase omega subunit
MLRQAGIRETFDSPGVSDCRLEEMPSCCVMSDGYRGDTMKEEAMENIIGQIDNRYEAIRVIAREARRINTIIRLSGQEIEEKPTSIAIKRLVEGKVKYEYEEAKK